MFSKLIVNTLLLKFVVIYFHKFFPNLKLSINVCNKSSLCVPVTHYSHRWLFGRECHHCQRKMTHSINQWQNEELGSIFSDGDCLAPWQQTTKWVIDPLELSPFGLPWLAFCHKATKTVCLGEMKKNFKTLVCAT